MPIERHKDGQRRAALARVVRPFLLRRTKREVAPELPPKTEVERFVELSPAERARYEELRASIIASSGQAAANPEENARFQLLAALTRLRQLARHPVLVDDTWPTPSSKARALVELLTELKEEGHRALVFSQFRSLLRVVAKDLAQAGLTVLSLDGETPAEERAGLVTRFQSGEADAFLISLRAGGTGLNLTEASYVIHLDPWWNPAVEDQATDRAHRIGQKKSITVVRLVARGTVESPCWRSTATSAI